MYNSEIEFANLNINWRFPFIISRLPMPSTDSFDFLVKELQPFGVTARSINLESPSSNLDDVALVINLLKPELQLRITYSGFDFEVRDIEADETLQILQILKATYDSLEKIDAEIKNGFGITRISLHLKLLEQDIERYISERASAKINNQNITPEALVFSLDFDEITKHLPTKITIAKSIAVENGLFLEINYQYGKSAQEFQVKEPMAFFQQLTEHIQTILSILELKLELNPIIKEDVK